MWRNAPNAPTQQDSSLTHPASQPDRLHQRTSHSVLIFYFDENVISDIQGYSGTRRAFLPLMQENDATSSQQGTQGTSSNIWMQITDDEHKKENLCYW
ncbi:hypothetical protein E2C01_043190 [Portunus trituberculatus]|uniref:Uncharacterized protein n=1 Tax=Portunus trituberculatus TaxID=210409 RepID=A0A5B7FPM0_PORTR|nr:hypothetical protein [Portunus trituberculatus]